MITKQIPVLLDGNIYDLGPNAQPGLYIVIMGGAVYVVEKTEYGSLHWLTSLTPEKLST